ncbi:MAG TPA: type I-U CRISPR-associated helicase/endonuclease Cas3 [Trebonia sp.]|nr:type I-U CRISPR-associated helicase/endonuclease Cas3 [Trebonia sp.]
MSLKPDDFEEFFAAVNGNRHPFRWQKNLLGTVLGNGRWPDRVAAPTGAGKTSAIEVHVFATALTAYNGGPRLPRRLVMVVDRRVLVDDQYERARALTRALASALASDESSVVREVAETLASLRKPNGDADGETPRLPALVTARLRGGSVPSRSWRDYPAACGVLCATPDMWGSRLIFGGYGTADRAASREAGLLAFDSVVLVDEAHLSRQLLVTAERVSQLAGVAEQPLSGVPALQVVAVSATPGDGGEERVSVSVDESDLTEERLGRRLTTPKPVRLVHVPEWPQSKQLPKIAAAAAQAVTEMRAELAAVVPGAEARAAEGCEPGAVGAGASEKPAATIGCYVNTVPMALAVAGLLRREGLCVVTVCGQVRPADLDRLKGEYPGLLSVAGNGQVDVVVTTQSLEVGADLDLAGIVTELATGSALAQRAGRVNRLGMRRYGAVTVVVPPGALPEDKGVHSGPYSARELNEALTWIRERADDDLGVAPWAVHRSVPPAADRRRVLYQRPELGDAWHWARTSDELTAEPELELWLSDSLEAETSVGIVVRDALPTDPAEAIALVRDLPPDRREVFPVPYRTAVAALDELLPVDTPGRKERPGPDRNKQSRPAPVPVRVRGEEITPLRRRDNNRLDLRPGDLVVVDSSARIATPTTAGMFSPPVVVAPAKSDVDDALEDARRRPADDVLHYLPDPEPGRLVLRIEYGPHREQPIAGFPPDLARRIVSEFAESFADQPEGNRHKSLAALLEAVPDDEIPDALRPLVKAAATLLRGRVKDSDVILRQSDDGGGRVVVLDNRRVIAEEDRQIFARRENAVYLDAHQQAVADRASWLGSALSLTSDLVAALHVAGLHHDDGKADLRFQAVRLGESGDGRPLAKSRRRETIREVREHRSDGGLPTGWRHEQRSVVDSWAAVQAAPVDPEMTLRLVGTSHGCGRTGFPHSSDELAGPSDPANWRSLAADLFDSGGWDELIERTHARHGVWGCAYLEAVLRAADCQVSGEGK